MTGAVRDLPHRPVAALCVGIAAANVFRAPSVSVVLAALTLGLLATVANGQHRPGLVLLALGLGGLWWGSARLDALDRSPLLEQVDRAERSLVVVTGPPRRARYELRVQCGLEIMRWQFFTREEIADLCGVLTARLEELDQSYLAKRA